MNPHPISCGPYSSMARKPKQQHVTSSNLTIPWIFGCSIARILQAGRPPHVLSAFAGFHLWTLPSCPDLNVSAPAVGCSLIWVAQSQTLRSETSPFHPRLPGRSTVQYPSDAVAWCAWRVHRCRGSGADWAMLFNPVPSLVGSAYWEVNRSPPNHWILTENCLQQVNVQGPC